MNTNPFLGFDVAVEQVLDRAKSGVLTSYEEALAERQATELIVGLHVTSKAAIIERRQLLADQVKGSGHIYAIEADALVSKLSAIGVKPLVVLPSKLWDAIVDEMGLYTFHNQRGDGKVSVSPTFDSVPKFAASENLGDGWLGFSIITMIVLLFTTVFGLYLSTEESCSTWIGVSSFLTMGCTLSYFLYRSARSRYIQDEVRKAGGIHAFLWPDKKESSLRSNGKDSSSLAVSFPHPPQEVQEIIANVAKNYDKGNLKLVVDKDAIMFAVDPVDQMIAKVKEEQIELELRRRAAMRADPIVTIQSGGGLVTAILAQYGDFPIERQAVAKAVEQFSFAD